MSEFSGSTQVTEQASAPKNLQVYPSDFLRIAGGQPAGAKVARPRPVAPWAWIVGGMCLTMLALLIIGVLFIGNALLRLQEVIKESAFASVGITGVDVPQTIRANGANVKLVFRLSYADNTPLPDGAIVHLEASGGAVDPLAATQDGLARAYFKPDPNVEQAIIVARAGGAEKAFIIKVEQPPQLGAIVLSPARSRLLADGQDATFISIQTMDSQNWPLPDVRLSLQTEPNDAGVLSQTEVTTDVTGKAQVNLTAGRQATELTIIAQAGNVISAQTRLELVSARPRLDVAFSTTSPLVSEVVTAHVRLADGLNRPIVGLPVNFQVRSGECRLLGSGGQTLAYSDITLDTDQEGNALFRCRVGATPGEVAFLIRSGDLEQQVLLTVSKRIPASLAIHMKAQDGDMQDTLPFTLTVQDQRGAPLPDATVWLMMDPPDMGQMPQRVTTGRDGVAQAAFDALKMGEVTIVATAGDVSASVAIMAKGKDSDGDGRLDLREKMLGTDPNVQDDKIKIAGDLLMNDATQSLFEDMPAGVVLVRLANASEGLQGVKLYVWVDQEVLDMETSRLAGGGTMVALMERTNPDRPQEFQAKLTANARGYPVKIIKDKVKGRWQLVEIEGLFPLANLDRP